MVLDTSAIIAAIADEPDSSRYQSAIQNETNLAMTSVNALETRIVLSSRFSEETLRAFDRLLIDHTIEVVPFTAELADAAFDAYRRFGKGQGHKAQLNICDCASYALALLRNDTLLFKGDDFARTDIRSAT
jgi:ribonuclease VapC